MFWMNFGEVWMVGLIGHERNRSKKSKYCGLKFGIWDSGFVLKSGKMRFIYVQAWRSVTHVTHTTYVHNKHSRMLR